MEKKEELEYIRRIREGETELFACFLEQYSRPVFTLIVRIVNRPEEAEELMQDTFLKAYQALGRYKGESSFLTWIYRIAYNTAVSATRSRKPESLSLEDHLISSVADEQADRILCPTDDEEKMLKLQQAVELLSVEERTLIFLFYYEEKTIREIEEITGYKESNLKVKLHRIRKKLYVLINGEVYGSSKR